MVSRLRALLSRCVNTLLLRADIVDVTNVIGGARRIGTTKAWGCSGHRYVGGDAVPHLRNRSTYSVATVGGHWVNVVNGRIDSWSVKPIHDSVADVYGRMRVAPIRGRR